jgi:CRP/FNR family cyclic AMP-dependent transcriptional regulator
LFEELKPKFTPSEFLMTHGPGRKVVQLKPKEPLFSQGNPADCIFYLQKGRARITATSNSGKEATIALVSPGDFIGEESIATIFGLRVATAIAVTACTALKIERSEMLRVIREEHTFADLFLAFMITRSMRTQADLVDHMFNSSEKRLARVLLLMAQLDKPGESRTLIPKMTQEALAEMVGTTRGRVNFFMNRFKKLGYIAYDGGIRVNNSLLDIVS